MLLSLIWKSRADESSEMTAEIRSSSGPSETISMRWQQHICVGSGMSLRMIGAVQPSPTYGLNQMHVRQLIAWSSTRLLEMTYSPCSPSGNSRRRLL